MPGRGRRSSNIAGGQSTAVDADTMWRFEPHVAEAVFRQMLAEAKVPVVLGQRLDWKKGVRREGTRITALRMESGRVFAGPHVHRRHL